MFVTVLSMKHFHIALKTMVDSDLRSQAEIARVANTTPTTISRICSGMDCSAEVMGQIANAFPQPGHRLALLRTWLLDRAEESGFTEADISAAYGSSHGLHIPAEIRPALEVLLPMAADTPEIASLLNTLAGLTTRLTTEAQHEVAEGDGPANLPEPKPVSYAAPKKPRK